MARTWKRSFGLTVLAVVAVLPLALRADERVRLEATLVGTDADPGAFGRARFEAESERVRFEARVEGVTQAGVVAVVVDKHFLGLIELDDQGRGELRLDSQNGDEIPLLQAGQFVGIFDLETLDLLVLGEFVET